MSMRLVQTVGGLALIMLIGLAPPAVRAQDYVVEATAFVQRLADEAIEKLTDPSLTRAEREGEFRRLMNENFAVDGIARFMLGRYWRRATPAQREEYKQLYQDVLVATWTGPFSRYQGAGIEVTQAFAAKGARPGENAVLVRGLADLGTGKPIRVVWRVANQGDVYKIADVLVEGISMATTQRDEFASVIRANNGEVEGLLAILRDRRAAALAAAQN